MTAHDDLLRGDDVDAFELGSNEVEVQQSRNAAMNPKRVTSRTSDTAQTSQIGAQGPLTAHLRAMEEGA